jgi:hypothetical protein
MKDFIRRSHAEFGDWLWSAVVQLNLELDAMSALLDVRRSLVRTSLGCPPP